MLAVVVSVVYNFGLMFLVRLVVGLFYAALALLFFIVASILLYAKSFKYAIFSFIGLVTSAYATYQCYVWSSPLHIGYITIFYLAAAFFGIWWITEDMSITERLRSAQSLEKAGNYRSAARKYEKKGNNKKAAECYIKAGMLESAAWNYEKAERYKEAAELYMKLAEDKKESYYWREAYELWKKAGRKDKAAECLEYYAEDEPWYWEDAAKLWEDAGNAEKAKNTWKNALEYYLREAEEEGVFWEDVAKIYEKLEDAEKAKQAMLKYAKYCEKEAVKDETWWKHVAEAYEKLGMKEEAENARKKYEEYQRVG
jgi:tetratricopeptide (TPR) repeat protein